AMAKSSLANVEANATPRRPVPSGPDDVAAVRMQDLAADVGRVLARQEHVAGRNLVRLAGPLHRYAGAVMRDTLRLERGRNERRPDRARRDGVDAYAVLGQRLRQRARQRDDGAFRGGI